MVVSTASWAHSTKGEPFWLKHATQGLSSVGWLPVPLLVLGSFPVCALSGFGAAPWFPVSFLLAIAAGATDRIAGDRAQFKISRATAGRRAQYK